ncbi:g5019 [Coccomyxa viridis]|uniref:G5019 protein n=1 Tax=Coccomyxa viridis TaxID=1274662 RepID=A0ABP1FRQ7_9CHLO
MGTSQSRPGGAPRGAPPGFERPSPQAVPPLDRQESLRSQTDSSAAVSAPGAVPDLPTQADNSIAVSAPGEKE